MSHDRRARRVLGVLACLVVLAAFPGCRRSPFHRLGGAPEIGPDGRREGFQPPIPALDQAAVEQPAREARETSMAAAVVEPPPAVAIAPVPEPAAEPIPTPMLDEALKRAEAMERAQQDTMRQLAQLTAPRPEPEPEPAPEPIRLEPPRRDEAVATAAAEVKVEEPAPPPAPPADPAVEWRDGVDRLKKLARESADGTDSADGDDQAKLWTARAELIDCLPDDLSTAPLSNEIESAVSTLEKSVPLGVNAIELCRKIDGFGSFETVDPHALKPGRPVLVYCELAGLRYGREDDEFVARVSTRVELLRADDGAKVWEIQGEAEDRCRRRRRDSYVSTLLTIPETIEPGAYSLRVTQTDAAAGANATAELAIAIQP